jgi:Retinal pigment epithelial membrane protein
MMACPIAIDPQTLETRGEWPWRDDILLGADGNPRPEHTTPHPHFDRAAGDLINNVEAGCSLSIGPSNPSGQ